MLSQRPADDELEVSIFGPGVGECVVVHLGHQRWMVVDSCVNPNSGRPAALKYFDAIGVRVGESVATVVVTHWHDDHTAGVSEVLKAATTARFFCSAALGKREFMTLVASASELNLLADGGSGIDEMRRVLDVLDTRGSRSQGRIASPVYVTANTVLYRAPAGETPSFVEALSPSGASQTRGFVSLAPARNAPKRRLPNPGPNELSVVLHVQLGTVSALLGADLEVGSSDAVGWRAVVTDPRNPPGERASIVKIPHHGSSGADHPPMWSALVAPNPHTGVTPFHSSGLPRADDIERLRARSPNVVHTSPRQPKLAKLDRAALRTLEGVTIRERRSSLGHVRFRARAYGTVACECFGAATPL